MENSTLKIKIVLFTSYKSTNNHQFPNLRLLWRPLLFFFFFFLGDDSGSVCDIAFVNGDFRLQLLKIREFSNGQSKIPDKQNNSNVYLEGRALDTLGCFTSHA